MVAVDDELDGGEERIERGLAAGLLALAPLLVLHEWALAGAPGHRNTSELVLTLPLELLGDSARLVRGILFALLFFAALVHLFARGFDFRRGLARIYGEGLVGGIVFGPLLLFSLGLLGDAVPRAPVSGAPGAPGDLPELTRVGWFLGAAVWEELLFRVGVYGLLYLLGKRLALFLAGAIETEEREGPGPTWPEWIGEAAGLIGSSLAFAAFHFRPFLTWLGEGGEPFDAARFVWLFVAGALLGALFRWRGLGVVGLTHALFNAALALGAGPAVFAD